MVTAKQLRDVENILHTMAERGELKKVTFIPERIDDYDEITNVYCILRKHSMGEDRAFPDLWHCMLARDGEHEEVDVNWLDFGGMPYVHISEDELAVAMNEESSLPFACDLVQYRSEDGRRFLMELGCGE